MRIDAPARQKVSPSLEKAPPPALDFLPKNLYYRSIGFCTPGKDGIFEMSTRRQAKPRREKGRPARPQAGGARDCGADRPFAGRVHPVVRPCPVTGGAARPRTRETEELCLCVMILSANPPRPSSAIWRQANPCARKRDPWCGCPPTWKCPPAQAGSARRSGGCFPGIPVPEYLHGAGRPGHDRLCLKLSRLNPRRAHRAGNARCGAEGRLPSRRRRAWTSPSSSRKSSARALPAAKASSCRSSPAPARHFLRSTDTLWEYTLAAGQSIVVDTGNLAMCDASCSIDVQAVKGLKNMFLGGEASSTPSSPAPAASCCRPCR